MTNYLKGELCQFFFISKYFMPPQFCELIYTSMYFWLNQCHELTAFLSYK